MRTVLVFAVVGASLAVAGCSPTIKVQAPDKPIVINLNIKIEQEVRIRIDKDVDAAMSAKPGIF
ncbi:MAG: YnbE family lipoprotein [Rhodospirillaceae bacterium]|nr:YnbE family lipoprotein [Rhodospirillaceae bacterium]